MNSLYMILAIPILTLLNGILSYFTQILYHQVYEKYITIEPENLTRIPLPKIIGQTITNLIGFLLAPLIIRSQAGTENIGFYAMCGYFIGYLAFLVTKQIFSMIVFTYIKKNPTLVSGKAVFHFHAIRMINIASTIQQLIFISIIAFFAPSPFIIGTICGLALAIVIFYFSKFAQPIV